MLKFGESGHPVFRSTSPLSRGQLKSKGGGKTVDTLLCRQDTITTVFRPNISVNQHSLYGAVSDVREECESCHDRTGGPLVEGQSDRLFVPSVVKTNILFNDDPAQEEYLLQRYRERIGKLSQQDRLN